MTSSKKSLTQSIEKEISSDVETSQRLASKVEKTRGRQKSYIMDLRIHSPASLGYHGIEGLDSAPALVRVASVKGIDVIAVTDFYSGAYVDRVLQAATNTKVTVIPGVVIRCIVGECRDVTMSCLFPETANGAIIESFLSDIKVPRQAFGNRSFLLTTPLDEILAAIEKYNGVAIPSRMDKTPHRMAVLPLLVERYGFRAFDLAYADTTMVFKARWPKTKFHLFSFSNANALAQIGSRTARVKMSEPGFAGIRELVARG